MKNGQMGEWIDGEWIDGEWIGGRMDRCKNGQMKIKWIGRRMEDRRGEVARHTL